MAIKYHKKSNVFHIMGKDMSYVMGVNKHGYLQHIYWGKSISLCDTNAQLLIGGIFYDGQCSRPTNIVSLHECTRQEYPFFGTGDFKSPAFSTLDNNGHSTNELTYVSHKIVEGKPSLAALPSTYMEDDNEGETLIIQLQDSASSIFVYLSYTCYHDRNVLVRSVRFENHGSEDIKLEKALSMSVDMEDDQFDYLQLWGSWGNERNIDRKPISHGKHVVESKRGSSSHQKNPFVAITCKNADEDQGDVFGFSFVYSGSFISELEVEQYDFLRVNMGINPFGFSWTLEPNAEFQTPEVVMVYSNEGLGGMSRTYHSLYRERLCKGFHRDLERPILLNNWEATYFDYDAEKLIAIANDAQKLGIELFVLDDGWFGKRNNDSSSLGDWKVNLSKIPSGLDNLSKEIKSKGMKFGIWVEPEMVSPDSDLYRNHPDWCLHVRGKAPTEVRNQLVLDLSRDEVCEYIIQSVSEILSGGMIDYVKWDFNRELMDVGNDVLVAHKQKEINHRYVLGLYKIYETLNTHFPYVLFEGCASGGGRFDPGILYYMPQIWGSDNTDPISRLNIQYGTSLVYPMSTIGSHVSDSPNHQTGRSSSLSTRGNVAMSGCFGYELDPNDLSEIDKDEIKQQILFYKNLRSNIKDSDLYRLYDPSQGTKCAWMFVSKDKNYVFVQYTKILIKPVRYSIERIKLKGLDEDKIYNIEGSNHYYTGSELMGIGMDCSMMRVDFDSKIWVLKAG